MQDLYSQAYPRIDTLLVQPTTPTIYDSIQIISDSYIYSTGTTFRDSISIVGNTVLITNWISSNFQATPVTIRDTFQIGKLPAGQYTLHFKSYFGVMGTNSYTKTDSSDTSMNFQVIDDIGLYEVPLNHNTLRLFPNPASSIQELVLNTPIPQNLVISLHEVSGKKIQDIFSGLSVQGKQSFEVDLSQLPPGLYVYHVLMENEIRSLKFVKE